jgi:ABC-2 type transport system ATP-binding protein
MVDNLRKFAYVKDAKSIDNKIILTLDDPESQNPEIIRALINLGANLRFVGELRHSLEDVYLQLVQKE